MWSAIGRGIGEELEDLPVGKDRDACVGDVEVAEELARVIDVERFADLLALDEDLHLSILEDGVVDLFAFLGPHVTHILRRNFGGVEDVIAQHRMDEGHHECILCGFFSLDGGGLLADLCGECVQLLDELHDVHL